GTKREQTGLRLPRRTHGPGTADVVDDRRVSILLIGNLEDVRQRQFGATRHSAGAPSGRLPSGQVPLGVSTQLDRAVGGGSTTRGLLLGAPVHNQAHRDSTGELG